MYDPDREEPIPVRAGDSIRFRAVGLPEYERIRAAVEKNEYRPVIRGEGE